MIWASSRRSWTFRLPPNWTCLGSSTPKRPRRKNFTARRSLPSGGDGPIKTEALRGVKDTPTYFHDGRLMTLDDTVEFFNLILGTKLTPQEKKDLVAFMLTL